MNELQKHAEKDVAQTFAALCIAAPLLCGLAYVLMGWLIR